MACNRRCSQHSTHAFCQFFFFSFSSTSVLLRCRFFGFFAFSFIFFLWTFRIAFRCSCDAAAAAAALPSHLSIFAHQNRTHDAKYIHIIIITLMCMLCCNSLPLYHNNYRHTQQLLWGTFNLEIGNFWCLMRQTSIEYNSTTDSWLRLNIRARARARSHTSRCAATFIELALYAVFFFYYFLLSWFFFLSLLLLFLLKRTSFAHLQNCVWMR